MKYYSINKFSKMLGVTPQTFFSCKLQGKRANKAKQMIRELTAGDDNDKKL